MVSVKRHLAWKNDYAWQDYFNELPETQIALKHAAPLFYGLAITVRVLGLTKQIVKVPVANIGANWAVC